MSPVGGAEPAWPVGASLKSEPQDAASESNVSGLVVGLGKQQVPAVVAVLAAVRHDVAGLGRIVVGPRRQQVADAAAVDAVDRRLGFRATHVVRSWPSAGPLGPRSLCSLTSTRPPRTGPSPPPPPCRRAARCGPARGRRAGWPPGPA